MSVNRRVNRTPRNVEDVRRFSQKLVSANNRTTLGVDTVDDLVLDDEDKGLVMLADDGHYIRWRTVNVSAGVYTLIGDDLGTTKP